MNPFSSYTDDKLKALNKTFKSNQPFPYLSLENFVDEKFLEDVFTEIYNLEFFEKSNDLYHFQQSSDLKKCRQPSISKLRDILYSDSFRDSLQKIAGVELYGLSQDVAISAAIYENADRLLCHDDELEGRRIAFILYMVPKEWDEDDAGHLDLFNVDEKTKQPCSIAKSLLPKWNTFNFFEVSEKSYH